MVSGWRTTSLGDIADILTGHPFKSAGYIDDRDGIRLLRGDNVVQGSIRWEDAKRWPSDQCAGLSRFRLQENDLVVAMDRTWVNAGLKVSRVRVEDLPCLLVQRVARLRAGKDIDQEYLIQSVCTHSFEQYVKGGQTETAVPHISPTDLREFPLRLPPLPEQRRIATILRTWDEANEKLEALRTAKERRLEALREKLTFADADGEPTRLADATEELTNRNGEGALGRELVMGVTNSRGIVPMREQTIADDISRYKLVPHQAFAYNPMRVNVGSIAKNVAEHTILVSPDYVVFACVDGKLSADFLDHLRKTKWWAHYINSGGSGSVRQRTYYADLAAMKVPLPGYEEQVHIAEILNTAQQDVDATAREIDALQRQKRGLLQKLLTGEWRVTVDEPAEAAE